MIYSVVDGPMKEHYVYEFYHHHVLLKAYDEIGRNLSRLRLEIRTKYAAMAEDATKYVYYRELIPNLERQFCTMVVEGIKGGSIIIIAAQAERKVA